jgi:hypothetical protein
MSFLFCGKLLEGDSPKLVKETIIDLQQEVEEKHHNLFVASYSKEMVPKINLCSIGEMVVSTRKVVISFL